MPAPRGEVLSAAKGAVGAGRAWPRGPGETTAGGGIALALGASTDLPSSEGLPNQWGAKAHSVYLETSPLVRAYARNDHLDFAIPYDYAGVQHDSLPDFLVQLAPRAGLADGTTLIPERLRD